MVVPERFSPERFSIDLSTSDSDIDVLGHVSNIRYVAWIQDVAVAHLMALGYDLAACREFGGVFVVRRHEIDYLRPIYAGERVRLETWVDTIKRASSVRMTRVLRAVDRHGHIDDPPVEAAVCKTVWGYISLADGRPQRIPEPLLRAFQRSDSDAPL